MTEFFTILVLLPPAAAAFGVWFFRRRRLGIATRLATRALVIVGAGFAVLVVVAVGGILGTGYGEIERRQRPAIVELARAVTDADPATDSAAVVQQMALFRARNPDVGPVMFWRTACGRDCLLLSADPAALAAARAWAFASADEHDGSDPDDNELEAAGTPHFVATSAVRDPNGFPIGRLAVAVNSRWVRDRALRTGLVLVGLAYVLMLLSWWMTRRLIGLTVAQRVRRLVTVVDSDEPEETEDRPDRTDDELAALAYAIRSHVSRSVEQLREADRSMTDARALAARMESTATLAAGVAHDFNNLMAGVMANSQVLRADLHAEGEMAETLDTIVECAERGGQLAQQLLAFARGGKYHPVVVNLSQLVEETIRLETRANDDRIEFSLDLAHDLANVLADPTQIGQLVTNLVRNACEAIEDRGKVTVATANVQLGPGRAPALADLSEGPYVRLRVSDTGPGMTAETIARIFEPFFTTKTRGRGMGLAASYGIVTHHGGQLEVVSSPDRGTTFSAFLPATDQALDEAGAERRATGVGTGTILLVDDETVILTATRRLLERAGYTVMTATNGREAVRLARTAPGSIDVILLDMKMPVMDGPAAFGPLRTARPDARVILCSGYELDEAARGLLDRGASAFVSKPFRIEYLLFEIEKAVRDRAPQPS